MKHIIYYLKMFIIMSRRKMVKIKNINKNINKKYK